MHCEGDGAPRERANLQVHGCLIATARLRTRACVLLCVEEHDKKRCVHVYSSAWFCVFACTGVWQWAQVNLLFMNIIRGSAVAIATCQRQTLTIAPNLCSYISRYLCMKWRFTIGPAARLMYQLPAFLRSGWHLWKLKTAQALFTDEWSYSAGCTQTHTHARIQAFPIHGIYIPMQPPRKRYFKTWMKSKWNLNILAWRYASLVPRVDCTRSVESSQRGILGNGGAVCNATWV